MYVVLLLKTLCLFDFMPSYVLVMLLLRQPI